MSSSRKAGLPPFRITRIEAAPLFGESPKGGWSAEIRPEDSIHAIIAVHTDEGLTGYGSVFTDGRLVAGRPQGARAALSRRERAEPERVSEKLHQNTFWMGRGGTLTHTISGIDIALWDILGQATGLSVGRLLGGGLRKRVQPYCSLLMEEPKAMCDVVAQYRARASGLQDRLGAVRPRARRQARRGDRARGARGGGRDIASCSSMPARAMPTGRTASNGRCAPPRC